VRKLKWNDNFGFLLNVAAKLSRAELNKNLKKLNITMPQFVVIEFLNGKEQEDKDNLLNSPAVIAKNLRADRPTITGILDRLVKQGWVTRETNPDDRRSQSIALTQKAKKLLEQMNSIHNEINKMTLKNFKSKEITEFKDYVLRIIANLDKEKISCFNDDMDKGEL
jgi:DNA-binding MarR family transcriptional regulator